MNGEHQLGFGGMRIWDDGKLQFDPQIPEQWESYSFKINYRGSIIKVHKSQTSCEFFNESGASVSLWIKGQEVVLPSNETVSI